MTRFLDWLCSLLPVFRQKDWERAYQLGVDVGHARGFLTGYRLGVADTRMLQKLRDSAPVITTPVVSRGFSVSVSGGTVAGGTNEKPAGLRLADDQDAS